MKKIIISLAVLSILFSGITSSFGQTVSDEAKRHFNRGMAAVEMAKSANDYGNAIEEFKQSAMLAPDWPDVYYNLGMVQEKAGKYSESVTSLRQYLLLAPNASDAETVKSLVDKLEFKAEQVLTVAKIIDVLASGFQFSKEWNLSSDCATLFLGNSFLREGADAVKVLRATRYYPIVDDFQTIKVAVPVLKYTTVINVCDPSANKEFGGCDAVVENNVEVVSIRRVRVDQKVLRGGVGAGVATGQRLSCIYDKK